MKKEYVKKQIKEFEKRFNSPIKVMLLDGTNHFIINMIKNYGILSNSKNEDSGGFYSSINKFFIEYYTIQPDYLLVSFDNGGSTKHHKINKNYKANRHISFRNQFGTEKEYTDYKGASKREIKLFKEFLNCFPNTKLIEIPNSEGDFLLARAKAIIDRKLIHNIKNKVILFYFVTTDKDFYQLLIDPRTSILNPITGKLITQKNYRDFLDVRLDQLTLSRAIIGDKSDNVSGIKGIGNKTTEKIMKCITKEYCNVEEFLEEVRKIENVPKKELLLENAKLLEDNWKLFNLLDTDAMLSIQTITELEGIIAKLFKSKYPTMNIEKFFDLLKKENMSTFNTRNIIQYIKKHFPNIIFIDNNDNKIPSIQLSKYFMFSNKYDDSYLEDSKKELSEVTMETMQFDEDIEDF